MRRLRGLIIGLLGFFVAISANGANALSPEIKQAFAPTGKLRVALYTGGPANIIQGATPAESRGVGFDLGKGLARRLGVPFEPIIYPSPGAVTAGLNKGEWDVAFLARTPEREKSLNLSAPFLVIEHGYLVAAGSPIRTMAAVDRTGIRIGAPQGGSVNAPLARTIKNATIMPAPSLAAGATMLQLGQVDVFASNKANLFELADKMPGSRVLDGGFGVDEITMALPKGRRAAMPYVRQFLGEAKAKGLIKAAVARARLRGLVAR